MGTKGRWRTWLIGALLILIVFALAWANNHPNVGGEREAQRVWLTFGYSMIGILIFTGPLSMRSSSEYVAQRVLIVVLALFIGICIWWVGYLPTDPMGCSRVDAPDCHTTAITRWRALGEGMSVFFLAFLVTHAIGEYVERRRARKGTPLPSR